VRVVTVIPSLRATGGLERVATTLAVGVVERVERLVVCFALPGPFEAPLRDAGIDLVRIERPAPSLRGQLWAPLQLARIFRRERPDVVHAHNPAAAAAVSTARLVSGRRDAAIVTSFHGGPNEQARLASLVLGATSDLVVGVGPTSTRALGLPPGRTVTVLNAVDAEPGRSREEVRRSLGAEDAELVVNVGRYFGLKNQALLLDVLAEIAPRHPRLRALLVGAGPLEDDLRARVRQLGLEGVVDITGERRDVLDLVAAADVFVLSSDTEALPLALLEAMTLGRPVCSTAVGSIPDVVADGVSGLLVPPRDSGALAAAIERLLGDPEGAARLGEAGRRDIVRRFSVEEMVERTLIVYEDAARARRNHVP
jgi:glycosyltransferase involved in cell wall biosynthesis